MKKIIFVILCLFAVILSACQRTKISDMEKVGQTEMLVQRRSAYNQNQIAELFNESDAFTCFKELNITQYKMLNEACYTVVNAADGLCIIFFDMDGTNASVRQVEFSAPSIQQAVSCLKVGDTLEEVQAADPRGQYDFLYHSWDKFPRISYHFFENGDCYSIRYKGDVIAEIIRFTI